MFASLSQGSESHKQVSRNTHWVLRWYYTSRIVLFAVCAGNEVFLICLYLLAWFPKSWIVWAGLWSTGGIFLLKQILNVVQFAGACQVLVKMDMKKPDKKTG